MRRTLFALALTLLLVRFALPSRTVRTASAAPVGEVRIKDITNVEGVRVNKVSGFGLVAGLKGTGGKSPVTRQFAQNVLQRFGLRAGPTERTGVRDDARTRTDNVSVVFVQAELPAFSRRGSKIDVTISAFDDATSLQGGELLPTPLFGVDNRVYAMASGRVSIGGFSFRGAAASVQKNHPTTARVPNGAIVEDEVPVKISRDGSIGLVLHNADYETAQRIADAINKNIPGVASAVDAGTINLVVPPGLRARKVEFLGAIGNLTVVPDVKARVVINERTGTIVAGEHVKISRVMINHANLTAITSEAPQVSQPAPLSKGKTTVVPRTQLDVIEEKRPIHVFDATVTVGDLARALNVLGVTSRDLSAIFQQLKESGALHAELEFQ